MSHGTAAASNAEPNLTPLLDVVLQLLMFFMMCVNFVSDQIPENIKLPVAQSARPMDRRETDMMYLNLNSNGQLDVPGEEQPLTITQWKPFLKQRFSDAQRLSRDKGGSGEVNTTVVIRADKDNDYKQVYTLLQTCKQVGYRKLQLRAMTQG